MDDSQPDDEKRAYRHLIAVMDSDRAHWNALGEKLKFYYELLILQSASTDAFETVHTHKPELILVSPKVSPKGPIDAIQKLKEREPDLPIIFVAETEDPELIKDAMRCGAKDVVLNSEDRPVLIDKITKILVSNNKKKWETLPEQSKTALKESSSIFAAISDVLITGETIEFEDIKDNCGSLVEVVESGDFTEIMDGVKMHDDYTYAHSMRVGTLLTMLGHAAGFSKNDLLIMSTGGLLHDVGKMKIPHEVLNKPGKLTEEEFEIMKSHVPKTVDYLESCGNIPKGVMIIAEQHHEKLDGTGYPYGLKASELNELARMSSVVDVFSALTDRRVYKPEMPSDKAMRIMEEEMCSGHLDPHYVKLFKVLLQEKGVLSS